MRECCFVVGGGIVDWGWPGWALERWFNFVVATLVVHRSDLSHCCYHLAALVCNAALPPGLPGHCTCSMLFSPAPHNPPIPTRSCPANCRYCHNRYIRQFRELEPRRVLLGADEEPREDRTYAGYTLGLAQPPKRRKEALPPGQRRAGSGSADKAVELWKRKGGPDTHAHALAPEKTATFGQGPASRYLVQHWRDGTPCDKTGRPREVEVQVHCAMGSADIIYDVREVATCQYTVVIHSPHLCSLPGFHPESDDDITPAPTRCREVVSDDFLKHWLQVQENQRLLRLPEQRERESGERSERAEGETVSGESGEPGEAAEPREPGEQGEGEPDAAGSPEGNEPHADAKREDGQPDSPSTADAETDQLATLFLDALGENIRTLNGRLEADLVRQIDAMLKHKAAGGAGQGQGQRRPRGQGAPHPAAGAAGAGTGGKAEGEAEAKVIVVSLEDGNDNDRRRYLRQLMGSVQRELDELEGKEGKGTEAKEVKEGMEGKQAEGERERDGRQGDAEGGAGDEGGRAAVRDEL